ncbi:hypothetical protein HRR83_001342 [Exophiala dermatitidis]|uniref:Uncharacterized protein n=1 Tax=Exophiala dermatitidis TaxID=5970 RepID=A0AAN6EZV2_EXODE|nr:hypothetical protein HRR74_001346 [Exophiala dermatitidis]KAJ4526902.1 hypothetical protein HRR73_001699 [Exophiala dermatitidis]KAJ4532614.1 hypothetical protein HRR76_007601 [Exophiala dermatitidis]KAJ4546873.1 hypothetical protein HRR77_004415 [Exophiala dermatitidis]KAJ4573764.1 hypothetical protein HRR79_002774 [Exophiala dermatitidis]
MVVNEGLVEDWDVEIEEEVDLELDPVFCVAPEIVIDEPVLEEVRETKLVLKPVLEPEVEEEVLE